MQLIIRPDAETDIAEGYEWYESQRPGLGAGFVAEVSAAIAAIQEMPLRFPLAVRRTHRAMLHRFPYGLFFVVNENCIIVVAVMRMTRNPRRIRHRAE